MRFFIAFAILASCLCVPTFATDDLYSEVALGQVFTSATKADTGGHEASSANTDRIIGTGTLTKLLSKAGYDAKKEDGNMVSTTVRHRAWEFSVYLSLSVVEDRLTIEMPVTKVDDVTKVDPQKLLELLSVGEQEGDVFFSFSSDESLIELRKVIDNRGVTANSMIETLVGMALAAEAYQEAWSAVGKAIETESPSSPSDVQTKLQSQPSASSPPKPQLTLTGTWTAALGKNQAFAIELKSDSTFRLVHLNAGKSTISEGKAERNGDRLTLAGDDGVTISGSVTQTSASAFQLAILGDDGTPGLKLEFRSAK